MVSMLSSPDMLFCLCTLRFHVHFLLIIITARILGDRKTKKILKNDTIHAYKAVGQGYSSK